MNLNGFFANHDGINHGSQVVTLSRVRWVIESLSHICGEIRDGLYVHPGLGSKFSCNLISLSLGDCQVFLRDFEAPFEFFVSSLHQAFSHQGIEVFKLFLCSCYSAFSGRNSFSRILR